MAALHDSGERDDGIIALVKETADGLGQLVADHIKLARIEMTADAKGYVRDVGVLLVGAFVLAIGYGLACIAVGTALGRVIGAPLAFACLAVLHLAIGAFALALARSRMKRVQLMHDTKLEVSRSMGVFSKRALSARSH
ncbi:MAG TPA: phage holin family protein [Polyangia bacterium]|jgi:hypothetical protein